MNISPNGIEIVADFYGIEKNLLKDEVSLTNIFRNILAKTDFKIIKEYSYKFGCKGEGVTGIFLLSESHATFHSYPEWGSLAINVFSCGKAKPQVALEYLTREFKPTQVCKTSVKRNFDIFSSIGFISSAQNNLFEK